jgi:PAS domain S-box-containing protein
MGLVAQPYTEVDSGPNEMMVQLLRKNRCCRWLALLCGACLTMSGALAEDRVLEVGAVQETSVSLTEYFTVLEDPGQALTLEDVQKPEVASRFASGQRVGSSLNFGFTQSAYWLRLVLFNPDDRPVERMLEINYARLSHIQFYQQDESRSYRSVLTGNIHPFASRPYPNRNFVFPVVVPARTTQVLYMRLQSTPALIVPAILWEPRAFLLHEHTDYAWQMWYVGIASAMILFNLLLYIALRDVTYALYVGFIFCASLTFASDKGLTKEFLWGDSGMWSEISVGIGYSLTLAAGLLFMRKMLNTERVIARFDRILKMLTVFFLLLPATFFVSYSAFVKPAQFLYIGAGALIFGTGAFCAYRRQRSAYFFLVAFTLLIVGGIVSAAWGLGWLPTSILTAYSMQSGSAAEMLLLAFALADRINIIRAENAAVRANIMAEQARTDALRQSQQRYRDVIDHVGEGMLVMQEEQVRFVNQHAAQILGLPKDALMAGGFLSRIPPGQRETLQSRLAARLAGQPLPDRYEIQVQPAADGLIWLEVGDALLPSVEGNRVLVFFSDLTRRKLAEEETRNALDRQQELIQLRARFVEVCSHEFRGPLANIATAQEILLRHGERLPEESKVKLAETTMSEVRLMTEMVSQILLVGKAEAHMLGFQPRRLDPGEFCQSLAAEAQSADTKCVLVTEIAPDLPAGLYDPQLLRHILLNLLTNAFKYSPDGGEVRFRVYREGEKVVFEVSDQGIGIPEGDLPHLFAPFHRARNAGGIQGTGLGLSIVKSAVERHGGSIGVVSRVGRGSCFTVRLPLGEACA